MPEPARLQQAINDIKRDAQKYRGYLELADWLQEVANAEQYEVALKRSVGKLEQEKASWHNQAEAIIKAAEENAAGIIANAQNNATAIARSAQDSKDSAAATVHQMITDAKVQAQKMIDEAQAKVDKARAELKIHLAEIDKAKEKTDLQSEFLKGINDAIVAAAGKRDQLLQHIADLKAKFS